MWYIVLFCDFLLNFAVRQNFENELWKTNKNKVFYHHIFITLPRIFTTQLTQYFKCFSHTLTHEKNALRRIIIIHCHHLHENMSRKCVSDRFKIHQKQSSIYAMRTTKHRIKTYNYTIYTKQWFSPVLLLWYYCAICTNTCNSSYFKHWYFAI